MRDDAVHFLLKDIFGLGATVIRLPRELIIAQSCVEDKERASQKSTPRTSLAAFVDGAPCISRKIQTQVERLK